MAVFEDSMYWTDRQINRVNRADKFKGSNNTVVTYKIAQPLGIAIYHPSNQPDETSPCDAAACSHLCLLSANRTGGFACVCPAGYRIQEDQRTCKEIEDLQFLLGMQDRGIRGFRMDVADKEWVAPLTVSSYESRKVERSKLHLAPRNHKKNSSPIYEVTFVRLTYSELI